MTVVALFWNGIVSIFVSSVIGGFRHGDPSWFGLLFLLPFVAIGLGLIAGAVYQFLAMFNPRPTLELSSSIIPLGGAAELSWSFSGQTSRIDEFTVTLRGVEEAKYRKGTSTYTDETRSTRWSSTGPPIRVKSPPDRSASSCRRTRCTPSRPRTTRSSGASTSTAVSKAGRM